MIEKKMKFTVGDKVRCIYEKDETGTPKEGSVVFVNLPYEYCYHVELNDGKCMTFKEDELELLSTIEPKIVIEGFMGGNLLDNGQVIPYDGFRKITNEMESLYFKKNADYGDSFTTLFKEFGLSYAFGHIVEKVERLKSLYKNGKLNNESVRDSLIDLANYSVMTIVELDKMKDYDKK